MSPPKIHLLGTIKLTTPSGATEYIATGLQPILVYLCLDGARGRNREVAMASLLPDTDVHMARRRLNTWLWRLRKTLSPHVGAPDPIVTTSSGQLSLCTELQCADAEHIERLEAAARSPLAGATTGTLESLDASASLAVDGLADGCFDDWVVRRREAIRLTVLRVLSSLADEWSRRGDVERAVGTSERLVDVDPLREDAHRRIMRLYFELGRRRQALRQYDECTRILRDELDVAPLPETELLAASIRSGAPSPVISVTVEPIKNVTPEPACAGDSNPLDDAIVACTEALRALTKLRSHRV